MTDQWEDECRKNRKASDMKENTESKYEVIFYSFFCKQKI